VKPGWSKSSKLTKEMKTQMQHSTDSSIESLLTQKFHFFETLFLCVLSVKKMMIPLLLILKKKQRQWFQLSLLTVSTIWKLFYFDVFDPVMFRFDVNEWRLFSSLECVFWHVHESNQNLPRKISVMFDFYSKLRVWL